MPRWVSGLRLGILPFSLCLEVGWNERVFFGKGSIWCSLVTVGRVMRTYPVDRGLTSDFSLAIEVAGNLKQRRCLTLMLGYTEKYYVGK